MPKKVPPFKYHFFSSFHRLDCARLWYMNYFSGIWHFLPYWNSKRLSLPQATKFTVNPIVHSLQLHRSVVGCDRCQWLWSYKCFKSTSFMNPVKHCLSVNQTIWLNLPLALFRTEQKDKIVLSKKSECQKWCSSWKNLQKRIREDFIG